MIKKLLTLGMLIFMTPWTIFAGQGHPIPVTYERIIQYEFNRLRAGESQYRSLDSLKTILAQTLVGKSMMEKNRIIQDVKALKFAINTALQQANLNGKRLWYWLYLWKDNYAVIDILQDYYYLVDAKLNELEWEMQTDFIKAGWIFTKYGAVFTAGMLATLIYQAVQAKARQS